MASRATMRVPYQSEQVTVAHAIALLMGYLTGNNALVEHRAKSFVGMGYANPTAGTLSRLGGLGGWFCILPAAYFVGSGDGGGFLVGLLFCAVAVAGGAVEPWLRWRRSLESTTCSVRRLARATSCLLAWST